MTGRFAVVAIGALAFAAVLPASADALVAPTLKVTVGAGDFVYEDQPAKATAKMTGATADAGGLVTFYRGNPDCGELVATTSSTVVNGVIEPGPDLNNHQPGEHGVVAKYGGDAKNPPAQSACTRYTIKKRIALGVSLEKSSVLINEPVRPTVTLGNATADAGGSLAFHRCDQPVGETAVANGVPKQVPDFQPRVLGTHSIGVTYKGDGKNAPATAACQTFKVGANITGKVRAGDGVLAGVEINLRQAGSIVMSTTTNPNGEYSFFVISAGNYTITETQPPGYVSTNPDAVDLTVTLSSMEGYDFSEEIAPSAAASPSKSSASPAAPTMVSKAFTGNAGFLLAGFVLVLVSIVVLALLVRQRAR